MFTTIGWYTKDTEYENVMKEYLLPSLKKLDLPFRIYPLISCVDWRKNTNLKSTVIRKAFEDENTDLFVVDADAIIHAYPKLLEEIPDEYDCAMFWLDWNCVDEETEILTNNGWKKYDNINKKDLALTYNIISNESEFKKINEIIIKNYNGTMFSFKGQRSDRLITPNHRELFRRKNGEICLDKYDKIPYQADLISYSINYKGVDNTEFNINEIKLLAWMLTEGNFQYTMLNKETIQAIRITQEKKYKKDIKDILDKLKIEYSVYNGTIFYINKIHCEKYINILKEKRLPNYIRNLPKNKLKILLNELIKGDGTFRNNGSLIYYSKDYGLISDVQEIALKCGFSSNLSNVERKERIFRDKKIKSSNTYVLNITNMKIKYGALDSNRTNKRKEYKPINYSGKIWCINTDNNTIICRRNGKAFVTGNSWYQNGSDVSELCSGTLYFRNRPICKNLIELWQGMGETHPGNPDQKNLQLAITAFNFQEENNDKIKIYHLPYEYCWINSLPGNREPFVKKPKQVIVEHFQVSRILKRSLSLCPKKKLR